MAQRRIFIAARTIHANAGIVLCLLLMTVGLSGALLVFKEDYLRATMPAARQSADLSPEALGRVMVTAEDSFGRPDIRALVFAKDGFGLHKAYLSDGAAYIAGDGAIIDEWGENGRIEDWLLDLHHRLLTGKTGLWVVGFAGMAAIIFIVAGLVAYWPARRGFRRGLTIASLRRPELLSLHRNTGVLMAPLLLLMISTGVLLTFPTTSGALFERLGGGEVAADASASSVEPVKTLEVTDWTSIIKASLEAFPDATPRMAIWQADTETAIIRLKQPSEWHPNGRTLFVVSVGQDGQGGEVSTFDATAAGAGREAFNAVYPLHAGYIGGRAYDAVLLAGGLGLFLLGLVGTMSFVKKYRFARRRDRRCDGISPASVLQGWSQARRPSD